MAPTDAPPAPPVRDPADVISIYGESYGTAVGLANVPWDVGSEFAEENIASNNVLKIDFVDFLGTQLNSVVDATAMTDFHMDIWILDDFVPGQIFNPKWMQRRSGTPKPFRKIRGKLVKGYSDHFPVLVQLKTTSNQSIIK